MASFCHYHLNWQALRFWFCHYHQNRCKPFPKSSKPRDRFYQLDHVSDSASNSNRNLYNVVMDMDKIEAIEG